jgi:hypothetical protein
MPVFPCNQLYLGALREIIMKLKICSRSACARPWSWLLLLRRCTYPLILPPSRFPCSAWQREIPRATRLLPFILKTNIICNVVIYFPFPVASHGVIQFLGKNYNKIGYEIKRCVRSYGKPTWCEWCALVISFSGNKQFHLKVSVKNKAEDVLKSSFKA